MAALIVVALKILFVLISCIVAADASAKPTSWELTPYKIHVVVATSVDAGLSSRATDELLRDLADRAESVVGGAWQLTAIHAPENSRQQIATAPDQIKADQIPKDALTGDKAILLAISAAPDGYRVSAREFDLTTGLWNTSVSRQAQRASLPAQAFRAVLAAFGPLARIDSIKGEQAVLRLRAGSLTLRDAAIEPVAPGVVFRPVLVDRDADGKMPTSVRPIASTFLIPDKVDGSLVQCRLQTVLAEPVLPDYHPRRVRLAVGVARGDRPTRLRLESTGDRPRPLEGYEVLAQDGDKPPVQVGRSDAIGVVVIPPGELASRMLLVRHGEEILTRLPMVPGLAEQVAIQLESDDQRLAAEAFAVGLRDQLVDLTATREVLLGRISSASERKQTAAVAKLTEQYKKLPSADQLAAQLDEYQKQLPAEGPQRERAEKLFAETRQLIAKYRAGIPATKAE